MSEKPCLEFEPLAGVMIPFADIYPETGIHETRVLSVLGDGGPLPAGDYAFVELFCAAPDCDCRRVTLQVFDPERRCAATLGYSFDPPGPGAPLYVPDLEEPYEQLCLVPMAAQGEHAEAVLELARDRVLDDPEYLRRLERHYAMVKEAARIRSRKRPVRRGSLRDLVSALASAPATRGQVRAGPKVGRNDPCPCGSGKKSKKCCSSPEAERARVSQARQLLEARRSQVYRLRIRREPEDGCLRTLELTGDSTFHRLHRLIQEHFGLDDDHLYSFFMSGRVWDRATEIQGNPLGEGAAAETALAEVALEAGASFAYLFDYGDELRYRIDVVDAAPAEAGTVYPRLVESEGDPPPQYDFEEDSFAECPVDAATAAAILESYRSLGLDSDEPRPPPPDRPPSDEELALAALALEVSEVEEDLLAIGDVHAMDVPFWIQYLLVAGLMHGKDPGALLGLARAVAEIFGDRFGQGLLAWALAAAGESDEARRVLAGIGRGTHEERASVLEFTGPARVLLGEVEAFRREATELRLALERDERFEDVLGSAVAQVEAFSAGRSPQQGV